MNSIKKIILRIGDPFFKWYFKRQAKSIQNKYIRDGIRTTRIYRYALAKVGKNFRCNGKPLIHDPEKIYVGDYFTINHGAQICPRGNVYIGNRVTMSRGSQITAGELDTTLWRRLRLHQSLPHSEKDVYIGDGTWLCINSVILPGVRITGKGVIVAAGAVVTKDITEDYVIVGGIPAKIVKRL